jgi:uncharacterized RDD family membrane protein YckC
MFAAAGVVRPIAASPVCPGIPRRLAAMTYELLLLCGVLAVALIFPHLLIANFTHRLATGLLLWAHLFLVLLVYFVAFWSRSGQTLAMKTWRVRLVTREGLAVRPSRALLRYLLAWLTLGLGGLGIVWALVDRDRQFLHDRLAGTRLVMA